MRELRNITALLTIGPFLPWNKLAGSLSISIIIGILAIIYRVIYQGVKLKINSQTLLGISLGILVLISGIGNADAGGDITKTITCWASLRYSVQVCVCVCGGGAGRPRGHWS